MSNAKPTLSFQCQNCQRKLKAGLQLVGKRVKCPGCGQPVTVPSLPANVDVGTVRSEPKSSAVEDLGDLLNLASPAIGDLATREKEAAEIKAQREEQRRAALKHRQKEIAGPQKVETIAAAKRYEEPEGKEEPQDEDELRLQPLDSVSSSSTSPSQSVVTPDVKLPASRSIFDEDLPELEALANQPADSVHPAPIPAPIKPAKPNRLPASAPSKASASSGSATPATQNKAGSKSTAQNVPVNPVPAASPSPFAGQSSFADELDDLQLSAEPEPEYRILCRTCGTPQYLKVSQQGDLIQCPDCHSEFKAPPPPANRPSKKPLISLNDADLPLSPQEALPYEKTEAGQRDITAAMLDKAKREIDDEDLEKLYENDFDTEGFVQRTFGFLRDPVAIAILLIFSVFYAGVYALIQFGSNNTALGFERGAMLVGLIGGALAGLVLAFPLFSCALALLESVANAQRRVQDWPGFEIFERAGELLCIAVALFASLLPGYFIGSWIGGEEAAAGRLQISGIMLTTFLFFPVFLLSILDNGHPLQIISGLVFKSMREAAEAWGAYYLKTMVGFATIMIAWYVLLGNEEWKAAIGGFLLPWLVFFTFQQIGALAESIGDSLSFEFVASDKATESNDESAEN